ncbi:MAG: UxaA family hydrolase [Thermoleophilia bacterium]
MTQPAAQTIRLHPADDVVIARVDIPEGTPIAATGARAAALIPAGHKIAVSAIDRGAPVRRYGEIIGFATTAIRPGDHVHSHNLAFGGFDHEHAFGVDARPLDRLRPAATFEGIVRPDGRIATRNYIGVVAGANCAAGPARLIADHFRGRLAGHPNIDGVVALTHTTGCGMAIASDGMDILRRTLTGYVRHPNFYAVLVVGLGCEVNQVDEWFAGAGLEPSGGLHVLNIQEGGGTAATVAAGAARIEALLSEANAVERRMVPAEHLVVGLQCGGSDGYSGIGANPALGAAADLLVRHGATAILSETPEIYGAEHLLIRRAASREVGEKLLARIRWWEEYAARNGSELDNNPSPGNKAGGLTTILEKSLGAATKGGTTNLEAVYEYAEPVVARGLVFMDTPGYDPVSVTGQVAGGANLVCFTTGRGSVAGCVPSPMLKLATTSRLYRHMQGDMDLDCGPIVDGVETVEQAGERIFSLILETASGCRTKSEALGLGQEEFAPWVVGATL